MGTNYYLYSEPCPACGKDDEERWYIGKSSYGWCFALEEMDLEEWKEVWTKGVIRDEYGKEISPECMLEIVTVRGVGGHLSVSAQFLKENCAEAGPNGLLRRQVDGVHCIAHGQGTWDITRGLS